MAQDFSFLRLSPTFAEAKNLGDPINSDKSLWQSNQVCLLPTEPYLQISNTAEGIAFDGDYLVEIIDCQESVLAIITDFVGIEEFTDKNGIEQIAFEIAPLGLDYYNTILFLRFTHTTGDDVYYSTPFVLSSIHERISSRFDYKGYGYFYGISYDRVPFYQSIRVRCYYDSPADETVVDGYKQISRYNEISSNMRIYEKNAYKSEYLNSFTYRALQTLMAHDIKFIDGVAITDKPTVEKGERLGNTNFFTANFTAGIDRGDTYTPELQIIEPLTLLSFSPEGTYTLDSLPVNITGSFNRNITLATGTIKIFNSDNDLLHTYTQADIMVEDNGFTVDATDYVTENGEYYAEMSAGLFVSAAESSALIRRDFVVGDGDWLNTDWNNNDWFTD